MPQKVLKVTKLKWGTNRGVSLSVTLLIAIISINYGFSWDTGLELELLVTARKASLTAVT